MKVNVLYHFTWRSLELVHPAGQRQNLLTTSAQRRLYPMFIRFYLCPQACAPGVADSLTTCSPTALTLILPHERKMATLLKTEGTDLSHKPSTNSMATVCNTSSSKENRQPGKGSWTIQNRVQSLQSMIVKPGFHHKRRWQTQ